MLFQSFIFSDYYILHTIDKILGNQIECVLDNFGQIKSCSILLYSVFTNEKKNQNITS